MEMHHLGGGFRVYFSCNRIHCRKKYRHRGVQNGRYRRFRQCAVCNSVRIFRMEYFASILFLTFEFAVATGAEIVSKFTQVMQCSTFAIHIYNLQIRRTLDKNLRRDSFFCFGKNIIMLKFNKSIMKQLTMNSSLLVWDDTILFLGIWQVFQFVTSFIFYSN